MLFLGFFDYIIGSRGFSTVYFCITVECAVREEGIVHTKLAGSDPQAFLSLSLCLLCQERKILSDFSQWIAGEFIGGWLAITD